MAKNLYIENLEFDIHVTQVFNTLAVECNQLDAKITQHQLDHNKFKYYIRIPNVSNSIALTFSGKQDQDTDVTAQGEILSDACFEIVNIWADNILLEKWALAAMCQFEPKLNDNQIKYFQTNNKPMIAIIKNEWTFYYNGTWSMSLDKFYECYHQTLISSLEGYNHWVRQSHIGIVSNKQLQKLENILSQLTYE